MQDCDNIVKLLKGREEQISSNELQLDYLFEYCPHDLRKIILNPRIHFQFSEIKVFLRQMLLGLEYMHGKMVSVKHLSITSKKISSAISRNTLDILLFVDFFSADAS